MHDTLAQRVDAALNDEADFEAVWNEVTQAIDAAPRDAALRRLRIRLAEAASQRAQQVADLQVLCEIEPADRLARLDLAVLQHRWAAWLADDDDAGEDEVDESDESDEADDVDEDADDEAAADALQAQAADALHGLLQAHLDDAAFAGLLLSRLDEARLWQPWRQLHWALAAAARHPGDAGLRHRLAQAWLGVEGQSPAVELPEGQVPVGFAVDVYGQLHDADAARRALLAIDDALALDPDDAVLRQRRAELWLGLSQFDAAAQAFGEAAQAWRRLAQTIGDADTREQAEAQAAEAEEQAARCARGRAALGEDWAADVQGALQRLGEPREPPPGAAENVRELLQDLQSQGEQTRRDLQAQWDDAWPQIQAASAAPDDEALAQMQQQAEGIAGHLVGSLSLVPLQWEPGAVLTEPALRSRVDEALGLGLVALGTYELPAYSAQFGHPVVAQLLASADGDTAVLLSAVRGMPVLDLETELSDGRQLLTSLGRGRNFLGGGDTVDTLQVDIDQPLAEVLALHRARVAWALARSPGVTVQPVRDAAAVLAQQERQRQAKNAHRLAVGLTLFEALAVPSDQPEHFVPLLQAAARTRLAQAHDAHRGATGA